MPKKTSKSEMTVRTKNKKASNPSIKTIDENLSYVKKDKMLEKVENYVNKNRETTSKAMIERKKKRPTKKYQKGDLEVMISRISSESKPKENTKENTKEISKLTVYSIYAIIFIAIMIFIIKYFFLGIASQIS